MIKSRSDDAHPSKQDPRRRRRLQFDYTACASCLLNDIPSATTYTVEYGCVLREEKKFDHISTIASAAVAPLFSQRRRAHLLPTSSVFFKKFPKNYRNALSDNGHDGFLMGTIQRRVSVQFSLVSSLYSGRLRCCCCSWIFGGRKKATCCSVCTTVPIKSGVINKKRALLGLISCLDTFAGERERERERERKASLSREREACFSGDIDDQAGKISRKSFIICQTCSCPQGRGLPRPNTIYQKKRGKKASLKKAN